VMRIDQSAATVPCTYSIAPTGQTLSSTGGGMTTTVTTGAGCTWTATSNASWLRITAGASGAGNGTVSLSADANTGAARVGTASIAGRTFTVSQEAASCVFLVTPTVLELDKSEQVQNITVTAAASCTWTASVTAAHASWLTIQSGASGTGNGLVVVQIEKLMGSGRTGTLTVAGHTVTVNQGK
jgi:hypothetical protein